MKLQHIKFQNTEFSIYLEFVDFLLMTDSHVGFWAWYIYTIIYAGKHRNSRKWLFYYAMKACVVQVTSVQN
jgi:hypothetical protein